MSDDRPPFAEVFGLLPPYTLEDLDTAYRDRSRTASAAEQRDLDEIHRDGQQYLTFRASRRTWLGHQVDGYSDRADLVERIESVGGSIALESSDYYEYSLGPDFGDVARRLVGITLNGGGFTDTLVEPLLAEPWLADELRVLDLAETQVTPAVLERVAGLQRLVALNLRDTATGSGIPDLVLRIPSLEWIHVGGTGLGWWSRWRLGWSRKDMFVEHRTEVTEPPGDVFGAPHVRLQRRLARFGAG